MSLASVPSLTSAARLLGRDVQPGGLLHVGKEVNDLRGEAAAGLGDLGGDHIEGGGYRSVAVTGDKLLDFAGDLAGILGSLADNPDRVIFHEQNAEPISRRRQLDLVQGHLPGAVKKGLALPGQVHAERAVQDQEVVRSPAARGEDARAIGPNRGPNVLGPGHDAGHGEHDQGDQGRAHAEQDKLLNSHAARVLLLSGQEEAHGCPGDDLEAAAIEEVNDDGDGNRAGAGEQCRFPQAEEGE